MNHPSDRSRLNRWIRRLAIGAGIAVGGFVLIVVGVGEYEFGLRAVPEPEVVRRVAAERANRRAAIPRNDETQPTTMTARTTVAAAHLRRPIGVDLRVPRGYEATPATFFIPRAEWGGWTLVKPEDYPTSVGLILFPGHPDLTAEQQQAREEINRLYRECQAVIDDCRRPDNGRSYRENDALLHEVFRNQQAHLNEFDEVLKDEKQQHLDQFNRSGNPLLPISDAEDDPSLRKIMDEWNGLIDQVREAWVENAVRREKWMGAARHAEDWDERVYYYRKVGGFEGYASLAGDLVQRQYRNVRRSHPLLERLLP